MKINQYDEFNGKITIVEPFGVIDSITAPILDDYITKLLDNGKLYIVLDFSYIDYISSSGIGAIFFLTKKITKLKGIFILSGINGEISDIFSILGFNKLIVSTQDKYQAVIKIQETLDSSQSLKNIPESDTETVEELTHYLENALHHPNNEEQFDASAFDIDPNELIIEGSHAIENIENDSFNAFIWECPNCKNMIQITNTGQNFCPGCFKNFNVNKDQTVFF